MDQQDFDIYNRGKVTSDDEEINAVGQDVQDTEVISLTPHGRQIGAQQQARTSTNFQNQYDPEMAPLNGIRSELDFNRMQQSHYQTQAQQSIFEPNFALKNNNYMNSELIPDDYDPLIGTTPSKSDGNEKLNRQDSLQSLPDWRKNKDRTELYKLQKRFEFGELKLSQIEETIKWNQLDMKGSRKTLFVKQVTQMNDLILNVTEQSRLEKQQNYEDRWPLLNIRKELQVIRIKINQFAENIMKSRAFETSCLLVIGANCYVLATADPTELIQSDTSVMVDNVFLGLYTIEMIVKIVALGFLLNEGAYIRDPWNILDFIIVGSSWLTVIEGLIGGGGGGNGLGALRAFRVLRPLKAITSIKGLQVLVVSVLQALPLLKDTFLILFMFFLVAGIAGLQLFSGLLKQRCVTILTGTKNAEFSDDSTNLLFCGGQNYCSDSDFCGRQIEGADYGITNFDNIFYGFLNVFTTITMEGWSEFMVKYQKAYTWLVGPCFYIPCAYIGGYFLLNLLLAVINSSFGTSNAIQQKKLAEEREKNKKKKKPVVGEDWKDPNSGEPIMEIGINEYFIAKRAAKKLIARLRAKQATKLLEEAFKKGNAGIEDDDEEEPEVEEKPVVVEESIILSDDIQELKPDPIEKDKVIEVQPEQQLNKSDSILMMESFDSADSDHGGQVTKFLKQLPKNEDLILKAKETAPLPSHQKFAANDLRVRRTKKIENVNRILDIKPSDTEKLIAKYEKPQLAIDQKLEDVLDIKKLLEGKDDQISNGDDFMNLSFVNSEHGYDLPHFSDDDQKPIVKDNNRLIDDSAIKSDSSFGEKIFNLKKEAHEDNAIKAPTLNPKRTDVMKEVKYKLTWLNKTKKTNKVQNLDLGSAISTQNAPKTTIGQEDDKNFLTLQTQQTQNTEQQPLIVDLGIGKSKTDKKKKQKTNHSAEDHEKKKAFKNIVDQAQNTFLELRKPNNPNDYIDKTLQKIEINCGQPYRGTSLDEILEIRNELLEAQEIEKGNQYILTKYLQDRKDKDLIYDSDEEFLKPQFEPYQLKTRYNIREVEEFEFDEDDEEAFQLELQPYDTVTNVGFASMLTQQPVKFRTRRSDIIVSSTLQITLSPAESMIKTKDLALLTPEQTEEWISNRYVFLAMGVKNATHAIRKPHTYKDHRLRIIEAIKENNKHAQVESMAVDQSASNLNNSVKVEEIKPKGGVLPPDLLRKTLRPEAMKDMTDEEKRLYNIQKNKWEAQQRLVKKMPVKPWDIKFTIQDARLFSQGKFHDDQNKDEDEEADQKNDDKNLTSYMSRDEDFYLRKLQDFDSKVKEIKEKQPRFVNHYQSVPYIPVEYQEELNLQNDLGTTVINFNEILLKDCNVKRKTPIWSGQDVLEIGLNKDLAIWIIEKINATRVWPKGPYNLIKKYRVFLKMIIKHEQFGNAMLAAVIGNTLIMSLGSYGISDAQVAQLEQFASYFTYLFIVEMTIKLMAIGVKKYVDDKMNWLDGGIVLLSIFEMVLTAIVGGSGNTGPFKIVKLMRTLRILRIIRILRSLSSMQVILGVFVRSASSFAYITMLLFVFLFIYTLLGMQVFGGKLNYPNEPRVRWNYDTFVVGFYTAFQVMSGENWNGNLIDTMKNQGIPVFISPAFHASWIFIGNYVLLNLFLAILLDSFLVEDQMEGEDYEQMLRQLEAKRQANIEKEKIRRLKKLGATVDRNAHKELMKNKLTQQASKKKVAEHMLEDVDDLETQTMRQIFMDQGIIRRQGGNQEEQGLFVGVECERSLYMFSKTNPIRIYAYKLYQWQPFDNFIMILIACSSTKLALATYEKYLPVGSPLLTVQEDSDIFINCCFLFECVNKIVSLGFAMDAGSYIKEGWNKLDFFIVCTSMIDMLLSGVDLPILKVLRLLRTLRPLRVISKSGAMRVIVASLFESVGSIGNVMLVVLTIWLMFSIFGMNLFAGKFFYCDNGDGTDYTLLDMYSCQNAGGTWAPWPENFDNIGFGILTLFCESSSESWPDIMIRSLDLVDVDKGPSIELHKENGMFFIVFMLLGNFFLMNFFTGVIFVKYNEAAGREKIGFTDEHLAWMDIQKMIIKAECPFEMIFKPPRQHKFRTKVWTFVNSNNFENFVMTTIVLNIAQMACVYDDCPQYWLDMIEYTNYMFTGIFVFEAALKLYVYRMAYFKTTWHKFDFFVVAASCFDVLVSNVPSDGGVFFQNVPQLIRICRVLRVTRIIKLALKNEGLEALLSTIMYAIGPIFNVFLLLVLVLFIFSVLGCFFFGNINPMWTGRAFYNYKNFVDFHHAFQTMFIVTTGEGWNYFMYDSWTWGPYCTQGYNCGWEYSPVYWIGYVTIVQFVMLNLFALVVIEQFELYYMSDDSPISKFKKNSEVFQKTWLMSTMKNRGVKIREKFLNDFFKLLPPPIGFPEGTSETQIRKIMLRMGIRSDNGYVYYNELLYRCMRRQYGNFKLGKRMQIKELVTQYKIYAITQRVQNQEKKAIDHDFFFENMVGIGKAINPFMLMMYYRISFNTWRNYTRKVNKKKKYEEAMLRKQKKFADLGRTFIPTPFEEQNTKVLHIPVEIEEILFLTSEEEVAEEEDSFELRQKQKLEDAAAQEEEKNKKYETAKTPLQRKKTMMDRSQKLRSAVQKKKPRLASSAKLNKDLSLLTVGINDKPVVKKVEEVKVEEVVEEKKKEEDQSEKNKKKKGKHEKEGKSKSKK